MGDITIFMAIVDFIPVVLFFISTLYLQKDFYPLMKKYIFAMLSAGSYLVLIGGIYKSIWKALYSLEICDYKALNSSFFPMQAPGFLLVFIAMLAYILEFKKNDNKLASVAVVPVVLSNIPFIIGQTIGCGGMQICLMIIAKKRKQLSAFMYFLVSFIAMLFMGYLGSRFNNSSNMNWIAEINNIISQGSLLVGVRLLHKASHIEEKIKFNNAC